jgi:hypothetical protein
MRVFRERELPEQDGLQRTARKEQIEAGKYPPPAKANEGGRAKIWFADEVHAWQRWRRACRDGTAPEGSTWRDYLA